MTLLKKYIFNLILEFHNDEAIFNKIDAKIGSGNFGTRIKAFFDDLSYEFDKIRFEEISKAIIVITEKFLKKVEGYFAVLISGYMMHFARSMHGLPYNVDNICTSMYLSSRKLAAENKLARNQKTFFDVLYAVCDWAYFNKELPVSQLLEGIEKTAKNALENSRLLKSKVWPARYLGTRAIGLYDSGALFIYLLIESFYRNWKEYELEKNK
ncbi:DAK2 domain-containing protein [[Mycoplasma] testudinis]|uniref:DAK2 domain-containing protein n=1 Tax=[Mycoplasma] testudinis TaxID=33924 RepID=UPI000488FB1B|nr:DAK2 domain-containing protein [[Mycoplasma] testudinis]